jgi:hypothetical protein
MTTNELLISYSCPEYPHPQIQWTELTNLNSPRTFAR